MIYTFVRSDGTEEAIEVEVADTPEARTRGLMGREDLGRGAGLLFDHGEQTLLAYTGTGCLNRIRAQFFDAAGAKVDDFWIEPGGGPYWPKGQYRFVLESFQDVEYEGFRA
jgi:uncharacterized membrane protein (UPF0127 family)